jgi:hypothetical protein
MVYANKIKKIQVIAHVTVEHRHLKRKFATTAPITTVMGLLTVTTRTVWSYVKYIHSVEIMNVMLMRRAVPVK